MRVLATAHGPRHERSFRVIIRAVLPALVLVASSTEKNDGIPLWMLLVWLAGTVVAWLTYWRFRTGWHMASGRMKPSPRLYPIQILLLYASLPVAIAMTGSAVALALLRWNLPAKSHGWADLFLLSSIVFIGGAAWAFKEYMSPTARRTPQWMRELGYGEPAAVS